MKKNFLLGALFLLLSCTPKSQGQSCEIPAPKKPTPMMHNVQVRKKVHLDARFTIDEVKKIYEASKEWTETSGGIVEYELVPGFKFDPNQPPPNKIIVLKFKSTDPMVAKLGIEDDVVSGIMVLPGTVVIVFMTDRLTSPDALKVHAMRNLGADLGIPTIKGAYPAVMNQDMDVDCLTKYDMILFCTKYVCDWKETNYCESTGTAKNKVDKL